MDIRYRRYINTALILCPMTFIMAFVGVTRNSGLHEGYILKIIGTWLTMFPIAFVCGLIIIPTANKLTNKIKFNQSQKSDSVLNRVWTLFVFGIFFHQFSLGFPQPILFVLFFLWKKEQIKLKKLKSKIETSHTFSFLISNFLFLKIAFK